MDRFPRYMKAIGAGTLVLYAVLAAPVAVQANPSLYEISGTFEIDQNTSSTIDLHNSVDVHFLLSEVSPSNIPANTTTGDGFVGSLPGLGGGGTAIVEPFSFITSFPDGPPGGSIWTVAVDQVTLDGTQVFKQDGPAFDVITFSNDAQSAVLTPVGTGFAFSVGDPLVVSNGLFTSVTPQVAGAPELDPGSATAPVVSLLGTLLLLSDGRRRKRPAPSV